MKIIGGSLIIIIVVVVIILVMMQSGDSGDGDATPIPSYNWYSQAWIDGGDMDGEHEYNDRSECEGSCTAYESCKAYAYRTKLGRCRLFDHLDERERGYRIMDDNYPWGIGIRDGGETVTNM